MEHELIHQEYNQGCQNVWQTSIHSDLPTYTAIQGFWQRWVSLHSRRLVHFATSESSQPSRDWQAQTQDLVRDRERAYSTLLQGLAIEQQRIRGAATITTSKLAESAEWAVLRQLLAEHDHLFKTLIARILNDLDTELRKARKVQRAVHGYAQGSSTHSKRIPLWGDV